MEIYVIKRNGAKKAFELFKIADAIDKAFDSVAVPKDPKVLANVVATLQEKTTWMVEDIQDLIEKELYKQGYFMVMRSFMLFRHTRKMQREHSGGLDEGTTYVNSAQAVDEYIRQTDWRINARQRFNHKQIYFS